MTVAPAVGVRVAIVGASDDHVVIFCGSGTTGAIAKFSSIVDLRRSAVVFVGPYEHHSNELPWRESIADVVVIPEDTDGHIDTARLGADMVRYADRPLKIGSFSAAGNVTGVASNGATYSWEHGFTGLHTVKLGLNYSFRP